MLSHSERNGFYDLLLAKMCHSRVEELKVASDVNVDERTSTTRILITSTTRKNRTFYRSFVVLHR